MRVSYDPQADAMYVYFDESKKSTETVEVRDDVLVDFAGKNIIGIEILAVSKKLPHEDMTSITLSIPSFQKPYISA